MTELFKNNFVKCKSGSLVQKDFEVATRQLSFPLPPEIDVAHPLNRLSLVTEQEKIEQHLRVTLDTRRDFLLTFFKRETPMIAKISSEPKRKCADLIEDYDIGPVAESGCRVM